MDKDAVQQALADLDSYLEQLGGCGNAYCIIVEPKGQHTNGGCFCWSDKMKMQRYAYAHNRFIKTIRTLL